MPGAAPSAPTSGAAFVVSTHSVAHGDHTLLVPIDPTIAARSADAVLLQVDSPPSVIAVGLAEPVTWLSRPGMGPCAVGCARTCAEELHGYARVEIDPQSFAIRATADCGACAPTENDDESEDADEVDAQSQDDESQDDESQDDESQDDESQDDESQDDESQDDESQDDDDCNSLGGSLASIVGGRAFVPLDGHNECGGWNIYHLDLATFPLTPGAWAAPSWPRARTSCDDEEHPEWSDFDGEVGASCTRSASGSFDDCGFCGDEPDLVVVTAWNGMLRYTGASPRGGANGGGPFWGAEVPLRPRNCPSPNDPCGDPASFEPVLGSIAGSRYWIATDASAALVLALDASYLHLTIRVFRRGETSPSRELTVPLTLSDVVSVRSHADAAPLARVIDHGVAMLHAEQACSPAAASAPAPTTAPPPATEPTTAEPATVQLTTAAPTCAPGERRAVEGPCERIALDAADEGFVDTRGGSGWGERCTLHLRAGALDAAEAACARGLEIAERPSTRGALFYNLGRIAEGRGDRAAARGAYESSLAARPGNAPTERALEALSAPTP